MYTTSPIPPSPADIPYTPLARPKNPSLISTTGSAINNITMASIFHHSHRARAAWLTCLAAAFRTAVACAIVGCTTLYGPASFRSLVGFPAFSYVTVILVVTDATLGDTLRGCWLGLYATAQSLGPAMLSMCLIGPSRFSRSVTALAVALGAFVVALPESTHLVSKRIALGQIVIVYVIGFINGDQTDAVMHPVRVAASTGVGLLACVLALLLPFPRLAFKEVKHNCQLFGENASERLKNLVKAFCAEDRSSALEAISQAKTLASTGTKLLQNVKRFQESMQWERPPLKCLKPCSLMMNPGDKMQDLEVPLRGLELALKNTPSFPVKILNGELKDGLFSMENNMNLGTYGGIQLNDSLTVPESVEEDKRFLQTVPNDIPPTHQDLASFFFLFCMKLLHMKKLASKVVPDTMVQKNSTNKDGIWIHIIPNMKVSNQRLLYAFKCSLSLGLAVFFGLIYSKENGFWAGLPVAISLSAGREPTFRVANLKAQGTVLGTVYGILVWFLFEKLLPLRLVSLVPWFVFTSFLQRSRMYGQAGAISAVIGAILVLGRIDFGPPSEFAIARIAETFIGLSCSIVVDLLMQPTRASTLTKIHLSRSLDTLSECIGSLSTATGQISKAHLEENRKKLKMNINELGKFIGEAELEPNFWFTPFPSGSYGKLIKSLSKMVDLVDFSAHALGSLQQYYSDHHDKETVIKMDGDIELFKKVVCSSIRCFQEVSLIKSLAVLEKEFEKSEMSHDVEMGKYSHNANNLNQLDEDEIDTILSCYMQRSREVIEKIKSPVVIDDHEGGDYDQEIMIKSQMVILSLSALGFCMSSFMRETKEIEVEIKEVVQWENPSSRVNLHDISCMIHALKK
ncbi:P-hydroxybenzoic acid efflux pump subunit [Trema orientale]|uniref:p-hydroxybenzoic acid efflux pump subunit n=1 Tax=Trema orientale TaxID=63057 RepID=A0A2P5BRN1_TREOI|nr:P-hydroxybenzoic acid efflux pump subunit [Trema orientale]